MPSMLICDITLTNTPFPNTYAYPPQVYTGPGSFEQLMIDTFRPNKNDIKSLIVHRRTDVGGTGIVKWAEAPTGPELLVVLQTTGPTTNQQRRFVNDYTDRAGFSRMDLSSWFSVVQGIVDEVQGFHDDGTRRVDVAAIVSAM